MTLFNGFLSTLSLRRATANWFDLWGWADYFYPRSPCGERLFLFPDVDIIKQISIHALLAESDVFSFRFSVFDFLFLSTLSLRRATIKGKPACAGYLHFYPRSPCGERRVHFDNFNLHCVISIHALLAESDDVLSSYFGRITFLSTLSLRRATVLVLCSFGGAFDFYPRSPCGERLLQRSESAQGHNFYPRSPCGERQRRHKKHLTSQVISIHALLAESDSC